MLNIELGLISANRRTKYPVDELRLLLRLNLHDIIEYEVEWIIDFVFIILVILIKLPVRIVRPVSS